MLRIAIISILFLASCQLPAEKKAAHRAEQLHTDTTFMRTVDTNLAIEAVEEKIPRPKAPPPIPSPQGAYSVVLPGNKRVLHIVVFHGDHSYEMEEHYPQDSLEKTRGSWSPSDGFIWAYKDQVVRARYRWKGKQLEYYSPTEKKGYVMNQMEEIGLNKVWQNKKTEGLGFYGIGNEPFWSLEIGKNDSVSFKLSDWKEPVETKLSLAVDRDSLVYISGDSLRVIILPHFCSDGMSDYLYRNQVRVVYKNTVYRGCGMRYR